MGIMMTGSIFNYTRNMKMSANWNFRKSTGSYIQKGSATALPRDNPLYSEFERYREQLAQMREQNDPDRVALYAKLESGKKLSPEELEYLQNNDPAAYQKYKEIEAEKESYKQALKRCKTKEDVERFHTTYVATRVAVANSIANNPNIPKAQKMALLVHENAKLQALAEETKAFKESSRYANMPTDAELQEELEREAEALRGEKEEIKPEETNETDKTEETEKPEEPQEAEPPKYNEAASSESPEHTESAQNDRQTKLDAVFPQSEKPKAKLSASPKNDLTYTSVHQADLKAETANYHFNTGYGREIYKLKTDVSSESEAAFRHHKKA